jgi:dTDP-4-dehydrorhamnose 3,5-epimerase
MIDGLLISRPKVFVDQRGSVMRLLRVDDPYFVGFGEVYFSTVNPGIIKGWKRHRSMTMTLAVPVGHIMMVFYDDRPGSRTNGNIYEVELGGNDYKIVTVPPGLWTGFMSLNDQPSLLTNCASILHQPEEADNLAIDDPTIPYRWRRPAS